MLRFRQKKILAVFVLLSLSINSFAESGLKEKTSTNLVELFKVKSHATDHIKGLEAKLLATNEVDQEELLVELAQSLLYYQDRHNKVSDSKAAISKGVSSLSANGAIGTSGKVSKLDSAKGPYSTLKIYRKALNAYKKASKLSLNKSRIKYTRKLSELAVKLQNKEELVQVFDELLQHGGDESGTYLAHVDYADGLAKFKDEGAEAQFLSAVNMRTAVDGVEANYRYANYLIKKNRLNEALNLLDKFKFEDRQMYIHIAILRQKTIHLMKLNTLEVDNELENIRKNLSNSSLIAIPKIASEVKRKLTNYLGLPTAYAYAFSHNNESDDTRGKHSNSWIHTSLLVGFSTRLVNAAEVIYNEARGDGYKGRLAIAWAIRNRATIDMNGCDYYPGAEGHHNVSVCRAATSSGPSSYHANVFRRYSCVVHGGTIDVGAIHSQMNDAHVSIDNLESSGILWELTYVVNGLIPDSTGISMFFPSGDIYQGNPSGAQEWRRVDYCPVNYSCKVRLGNVGGDSVDLGNLCPANGSSSTENYFWGRKSDLHDFGMLFK